jgi:hypothetical protein
MIQLANAPTQKTKDLEQQKADFTAEGAPPPEPTPPGSPVHPEPQDKKNSGADQARSKHAHSGATARG